MRDCNRAICLETVIRPELVERPLSDEERAALCAKYDEIVPNADCRYQAGESLRRIFEGTALIEMELAEGAQNA